MPTFAIPVAVLIVMFFVLITSTVKIVQEYERGVILRLGRLVELSASQQLAAAAEVISSQPATLQLRHLQVLTEIAAEKNSTMVFPLPLDLLQGFLKVPTPASAGLNGYVPRAPIPT
jgi:hypothetical protein